MSEWTLIYALIHTVFLIGITLRLHQLGFPGSTSIRLVALSLGIWPVLLLTGVLLHFPLFYLGLGLPATICLTLAYYVVLEFLASTANPREQGQRRQRAAEEVDASRQRAAEDVALIDRLVVLNSYIGESMSLMAIRDLSTLNQHGIPCRIEGSLIKTIFVATADFDRAAALLGLTGTTEAAAETTSP